METQSSVFHHQHPLFSPQLPQAATCTSWGTWLYSLPSTDTSAPSITKKALPCPCRALCKHRAHSHSLLARKCIKQVVIHPPNHSLGLSVKRDCIVAIHAFSWNILMEYSSQAGQSPVWCPTFSILLLQSALEPVQRRPS